MATPQKGKIVRNGSDPLGLGEGHVFIPQGLPGQIRTPKKKGFWRDQISTGGGIGGALGGAAAGAAVGSVVPVIGTAAGGILGALLGGAGGSAAGEVGENVLQGDRWSTNVGKEALIGGATALPIGAGFKLARAGVKATTGIGGRTAGELFQEAGMQTIGKRSVNKMLGNTIADNGGRTIDSRGLDALARLNQSQLDKRAGGGLLKSSRLGKIEESGNRALASQYGTLSKPTIRQTDPAGTVRELASIGITKPVDAERIGSQITGADGILTRAVSDAAGNTRGVETSTLRKVFNDALDNYGIVDKDRKSLQTVFDSQLNKLSGGARGSLNPRVAGTDALTTMKAMEKRIANLQGKGNNYRLSTPEREDMASVLKLVRDELEDQLYVGAGANKNLSQILTPQLREKLVNLQPSNSAWAKYVDNNIMSAKDVGSLRSAQAPFVKIGKIISEGDNNAFSAGGRMVSSANGIRGAIVEGAQNLVKNPAARAYAGTTRAITGGGSRAIKPVGQGLAGLTGREVLGRAFTGQEPQEAQNFEQALLNDPYAAQGDGNEGLQPGDPGYNETPYLEDGISGPVSAPNPFGVSLDEVGQAMVEALRTGNRKGFADLKDMYGIIQEMEASQGGAGGDLNAQSKTALATSANGIGTLDQLEQLYSATGGGSGKLSGAFQNTMARGGFNDNVASYNALANSSVSQIAKAINGGGQVSDADAAVIIQALPKITDSPQVARTKFAALKQRLENARQNTMYYGGGETDPGLSGALNGL